MLKILGAAILFLAVAIIVDHPSTRLGKVENTIRQAMSTEFNFMVVADWYEEKFGKPLAFYQNKKEKNKIQSDCSNTLYLLLVRY
ncbi:hypothetical protein AAHB53_23775 [Niallia circulans]